MLQLNNWNENEIVELWAPFRDFQIYQLSDATSQWNTYDSLQNTRYKNWNQNMYSPYALEEYRIRLIKCTVRVEFGKIFCRRGVAKHLHNRTPQWLTIRV